MRQHLPTAPFSRRDFLLVSGAAAALSVLDPPTRAARARPLACRLTSYVKFEAAAWTHLPSRGVKHLFLAVPEPDRIEQTMARLAHHSLTPLVMRGGADLSEESSVDTLAVQLDTCQKMGVRYMFLSPKHARAWEAVYEQLTKPGTSRRNTTSRSRLRRTSTWGPTDVHVETMKAIDHPNVRVVPQWNITFYNHNSNAVDELKKCIDYVATVEVKDHNGAFESWTFPALGKGIVDFKGVLRVLDEHDYAGPVTLEFEGTKGVELDEAGTKRAIEESIAYLRSIGSFV